MSFNRTSFRRAIAPPQRGSHPTAELDLNAKNPGVFHRRPLPSRSGRILETCGSVNRAIAADIEFAGNRRYLVQKEDILALRPHGEGRITGRTARSLCSSKLGESDSGMSVVLVNSVETTKQGLLLPQRIVAMRFVLRRQLTDTRIIRESPGFSWGKRHRNSHSDTQYHSVTTAETDR